MGCQLCDKELNAQLQVLMGRVKSLEDNVASQWETMILQTVKTIAGFVATVPNGELGAAVLLADPNLTQLIDGKIDELMAALPGTDFLEFVLKLAMDKLCELSPSALVSAVQDKANEELTSAQADLDAAIAAGDPQSTIDALTVIRDAAQDTVQISLTFFTTSDRASKCQTASSILGQ